VTFFTLQQNSGFLFFDSIMKLTFRAVSCDIIIVSEFVFSSW